MAANLLQIPAAQGGKWHRTSVDRLLHRLERLELSSGRRRPSNNERYGQHFEPKDYRGNALT
jgi:hypothetical protein